MEDLTTWSNRMMTAINLIEELERRNMIVLDMGGRTPNERKLYGKAILNALKDINQMDLFLSGYDVWYYNYTKDKSGKLASVSAIVAKNNPNH